MMAKGHRLRGLQMGEARHDGIGMLDGAINQRALKRRERLVDVVDNVAHVQTEIGRNLIVARTRGVQTARRRSEMGLGGAMKGRWNDGLPACRGVAGGGARSL